MDEILIRDVMTKNVVSIDENDSVKVAAEIMAKNRVGSLIVRSEFGPIGIITESDIIKKAVSKNTNIETTKASEIMNTPMIFAAPEQNIIDAASIMITNRIRRLPVIRDNKIVGIITHTDIVRASPAMVSLLGERLRMRSVDAEIPRSESRVRAGGMVGICERCGMYSTDLEIFDEDWMCEKCANEKHSANPERRKHGFKDWSRMS